MTDKKAKTYHKAFKEVVQRFPDDIALCFRGDTPQKLTYKELDAHSDRAAEKLLDAGCGKGLYIPLFLSRGMDCMIWALGVMKTGAAAVPLAADTPLSRVRYIIKDTNAPFILAHPVLSEKVPNQKTMIIEPDAWQQTPVTQQPGPGTLADNGPDASMMVYYTSGTTGVPKGVKITHRNAVTFSQRHNDLQNIRSGTRVCAYATVSFDAFLMDAYAPLLAGARVYLMDEPSRMSLVAIHRYFLRNKIEFAFLTTRLGEEYIRAFDNPHLTRLLTGGEVLRSFTPRRYEVMNLYGPTETTAYVTGCMVTESLEDYPLGQALSGMRVMVLDEDGQLCAPGKTGEICIAGTQVSSGYLNRPEETDKFFIANPHPKTQDAAFSRIYRTGDAGETGDDGTLYFRGRIDHQIKIRGFRIEPVEVEAAMLRHPEITHACVLGCLSEKGEAYLSAYFSRKCMDRSTDDFIRGLRTYLGENLPNQMVPKDIIELEAFPLNTNGKVDRSALPKPKVVEMKECKN